MQTFTHDRSLFGPSVWVGCDCDHREIRGVFVHSHWLRGAGCDVVRAVNRIGPNAGSHSSIGDPQPSFSCEMPYCSSFLYRFERGVPIAWAVAEMFQRFSRSLPTRNARSADSLKSFKEPAASGFADDVASPGRRSTPSMCSGRTSGPSTMIMRRSTVLRRSRALPRQL